MGGWRGLNPLTASDSRAISALALVALLVTLAGAGQSVAGAIVTGLTTDEPTHVARTDGWLADGWFVPPGLLEDGDPVQTDDATPYVYGPAFSALAHAANVVADNEPTASTSVSSSAWTVRHLISALIGICAALAVGLAVWLLTGSRVFALWGSAALFAIPIWTGMSFFNVKDLPAATGYTLLTVGLLLALHRPRSRASGAGVAALVASGIFLGAGTRLALWAALAASLLTFAAIVLARRRTGERAGGRGVAIGAVAGLVSVVALYPSAFSDPLELLWRSVTDSADFPYGALTLTAGSGISGDAPWWYLPVWGFASLPLLILALALGCGVVWIRSVAGSGAGGLRGRLRSAAERGDVGIALILQQLLLLSIGSIVIDASLYTGLRQHLYLVPAVAILAGVAAAWLWRRTDARGGWRRPVVATVLSAALLAPTAEQLLLFPYNYTYVNPVAGIGGVNDRWETDYWWASSREALSRVPDDAPLLCSALVPEADPDATPRFSDCGFNPLLTPYLEGRSVARSDEDAWVIAPKRGGNVVPAGCREADSVTRWMRGEDVLMAYVLRCDAAVLAGASPQPASE